MKKLIIGITGASGVIMGIHLLKILKKHPFETHLILSEQAKHNILIETSFSIADIENLATHHYDNNNLSAPISSGSFITDGMIVIPCSIKSLSAIANSFNNSLITRAADVCLKERRKLVTVIRETPLHEGHLELMLRLTRYGGIILPPIPAFYHNPKTMNELLDHLCGKILDQFHIDAQLFKRWEGT